MCLTGESPVVMDHPHLRNDVLEKCIIFKSNSGLMQVCTEKKKKKNLSHDTCWFSGVPYFARLFKQAL